MKSNFVVVGLNISILFVQPLVRVGLYVSAYGIYPTFVATSKLFTTRITDLDKINLVKLGKLGNGVLV